MACAEKAREKGFKFFGIQYYTECWSGTGAEKTYGRDGTSKDCENGVGKSAANFVYRFGDYSEYFTDRFSSNLTHVAVIKFCFKFTVTFFFLRVIFD